MQLCKLCEKIPPSVNAHIIPEWAYRYGLFDHSRYAIALSDSPRTFPSTRSTGEYDGNLVCEPCERRFSPWDGYAKEFFVDRQWDDDLSLSPHCPLAWAVDDFDYDKIKLFMLSLVWRMAESERPMFESIKLGSRTRVLRQRILAEDPGADTEWLVNFTRFRQCFVEGSTMDPSKSILGPYMGALEGIRHVNAYFAGFACRIWTDSRPPPPLWQRLAMRRDDKLHVVARDFVKSKELQVMTQVVQAIAARRS